MNNYSDLLQSITDSQSLYGDGGNQGVLENDDGTESFSLTAVNSIGCGCMGCSGSSGQGAVIQNGGISANDGSGAAIAADALVGGENGYSALHSDHVWTNDGTGLTLDFNFYTGLPGFYSSVGSEYNSGFQAMNGDQAQAVREVLSVIESYANITFNEVASGTTAADLSFGQVARSNTNVVAHAFLPTGHAASGDVFLNTTFWGYDSDPNIGDLVYQTIFHEVGHALGLKHSFDGTSGTEDTLIAAEENNQYSVMSYTRQGGNAGSMMMHDIAALQDWYGVNTSFNTGNDTYEVAAGYHQTIWDAGGIDTLDASAQSGDVVLRLEEGSLSEIGLRRTGIAFNAEIENATGGSGNDTIYGNDLDNVLRGGGGNDTLYGTIGSDTLNGENGNDTANYNYSVNAFAFNFINSVTVAFEHIAQSWTDTLSNIENFIFTDGSYTFAELEAAFNTTTNDFAPTVSANDLTLDLSATILAADIITADDADGNPLTYEVWDSGRPDDSGYFELDGVRLEVRQGHTMTQEEFDTLLIHGGSVDGEDSLWVRVSDGVHTTAWEAFTLTTAGGSGGGTPPVINTVPTANADDLTLGRGESVLASTVFSGSDADGDTLTYEVWDSGSKANSGYFELNGTILTAGRGHTLTQAEFDSLNIVGGSKDGTEHIWLRVSDGTDSTAWQKASLTTDTDTPGMGGVNNAPTVTVDDITLVAEAFVAANSIMDVNDVDGDTLTYEVWDSTSRNSSGYFDLNGTALAAGRSHSLTQAEFDQLTVVAGRYDGTDRLWIRASDGTETTAWRALTLTTDGAGDTGINDAPTATASHLTLNIGESILANTILSANDANGDTLTYEVWDSGNKNHSGYFELNGTRLTAGSGHELSLADFNQLLIVGGTQAGLDNLWFRAHDGHTTSAWQRFELTTQEAADFVMYNDVIDDGAGDLVLDDNSQQQTVADSGNGVTGGGLDVFTADNGLDETGSHTDFA